MKMEEAETREACVREEAAVVSHGLDSTEHIGALGCSAT